jgi:hypothetical protein
MSAQISAALARETIAALGPAARAFAKAQTKGHVWVGEQGSFETIDGTLVHDPAQPANPHQLRLV